MGGRTKMRRAAVVINFQNLNKTDISQFDNYARHFARQTFLRSIFETASVATEGDFFPEQDGRTLCNEFENKGCNFIFDNFSLLLHNIWRVANLVA